MKLFRLLSLFVLLAMVVGLSASPTAAKAPVVVETQSAADKIEDTLLLRFAADGTADFIARFTPQADLSAAYEMDWEARGQFVVDALNEAAKVQDAAKAYLADRGLRFETMIGGNDLYVFAGTQADALAVAELPQTASVRATQTYQIDPGTSYLKSYDLPITLAEPTALAWGISYTKADQFWAAFGVQGEGIKVANIDTGVQYDHPALDQSFACADPTDAACWSDPENWCGGSACDNNGHGTHTMGTMVGDDDPSLTWQAGMAPSSTWIACKGCGTSSCSDFALTSCANWILAPDGDTGNRPNVVNNSWGGGSGDPWYQSYVQAWVAAGIFPAFSAGNSGPTCSSIGDPGSYQESFASANHTNTGVINAGSSRGPSPFGDTPYTKPNISAPGTNVCSSVPGSGWSCGYTGTSMASPHTAGAVALLWSCNPALIGEIDQTFNLLQDSVVPPPDDGNCGVPGDGEGNFTYGYGLLDALAAGVLGCGSVDIGTIEGHVYEVDGVTPIEGATVTAVFSAPAGGNQINAITDPNGFYTMNLVVGTYDVTASKVNYAPQTVTDVVVTTGGTTTVDFDLSFLGSWTASDAQCFDLTRIDAEFFPGTGMVYVLGGRGGADGTVTYGNIFEIDPTTGDCSDTGALMPEPISNYTVSLVNDGTDDLLCTFGGRGSSGTNTQSIQCYDPAANTASVVGSLPAAYSGFVPGAQVVLDNMVYVFGGFRNTASPYELARTDRYDPTTGIFTQIGDLNQARSYLNAAVVDGAIYAFGGTVFDGASLFAQTTAEVMADPAGAGTWDDASVTDLPVANAEGRAFGFDSTAMYLPGQIVVAGGGEWPNETNEVFVYDVATDTYDYNFADLIQGRRDHAGVFVPLTSPDPFDGTPALWVFGGRTAGSDLPPYATAEFYPLVPAIPFAEIEVSVTELFAEQPADTVTTQQFDICNVGTGDLDWTMSEVEWPLKAPSSPFVPVNVTGSGQVAPITTAAPAAVPVVVPAANPEAVLWDQPLSTVNQNAYVNQDFSDFPDSSSWLADDFTNADPWLIETIFVPGNGWNGFTSFDNATSLTWQIFADDGTGFPAGDPAGGGDDPVWTLTLTPDDPMITITTGTGGLPSDTLLTLDAPVALPPGTYWLIFYPTMPFSGGGQYGRQPSDTANLEVAKFINPGGGFGFGPDWQDWTVLGVTEEDIAFRIEGTVGEPYDAPWLSEDPTSGTILPDECDTVEVTFDSTGLTPGDYTAALAIASNDDDEPVVDIPVTLTVLEPAPVIVVDPLVISVTLGMDETWDETVTVSNTGDADLEITDIVIPVDWLTVPFTDTTILPGEAEEFIFTFDTTGLDAGVYTTTVTIASNDVDVDVEVTLIVIAPDEFLLFMPIIFDDVDVP